MAESGGFLSRERAIFLAVLVLAGLAVMFWYATNREADTAVGELNPEAFAKLLQMAPNERNGMMFPEEWLEQFPYSSTAYAKYAEGLAADTPCASWENDGIRWWDRSAVSWERFPEHVEEQPELLVGWDAVVAFPVFRFCGFPSPYPEKPVETTASP